jgi:hypothetical protein
MQERFSREKVTYTGPARYRIVVDGYMEEDLSDYLAGMRVEGSQRADGTPITTLTGRIADQGQLNSVINAIYSMHLPVLAVEALPEEAE